MADEPQTVNEAEDNSELESSTSETNTLEVGNEAVTPEQTDKPTDSETSNNGKQVSGATKRIHELVDERDSYKARADSLEAKLEEYTSVRQYDTGNSQFTPQVNDNGEAELTISDIETIVNLRVNQANTVTRINAQAQRAIELNPILDKNSDQYDPDVNEAVTTAVLNEIKLDPSKDVLKLTDKYLKPYRKAAENAVGQEKKNIAQQVNDAALKPTNVKPVDKGFSDLSIEEMEARLQTVY